VPPPVRISTLFGFHCLFLLPLKVRSYLRNRASLPPITVGQGILNQGHRSLFERELLFLHDLLPKDTAVHDGLQLLDGADINRHLPHSNLSTEAAETPSTRRAVSAAARSVPALPEPAVGPVLPTPPQVVRLAPLPDGWPVLPGSQAARETERQRQGVTDEEEDDEIRPVADDYAAQWRAYYASRR